jgi:exopolysaccharide biosynthesis protein
MERTRKQALPLGKRIAIFATAATLVVGGILYGLADRYLIPHVEALAVTPTTSATTDASVTGSATTTNGVSVSDTSNYVSDDLSIHITQVVTGSGSSTLTYYVADVIVSDISQLLTAFAHDEFGRNIIQYTSEIAASHDALFAINGDYYGFRTDGVEIRNGILYRNVPARVGAVIRADGTMDFYDETQVSAATLLANGALQTLSFGPVLVENGIAKTDYTGYKVDDNMGNASNIAGNNPRTGIGMISANHYVFIVVDGRSSGYSRGATLAEFAAIFADLGCTQAYNLDGGGSSTLVFQGQVVNHPLGRNQERGVSDILYIKDE